MAPILNILASVCLIIALGVLRRSTRFTPPELPRGTNRLMMGADDTLAGAIILAATVHPFPTLSVVLLAI